jgi:hypothetical protein
MEAIMDIEADPGIEVRRGSFPNGSASQGNNDVLRADLRLRVPAEPVNWTEETLENLLHRRGMFMLRKIADTYTVVHRSKQGMLVRTRVSQLADGSVSLHRPSWPQVNDVPFASIEQMSNRLVEMGLTLQSRLPD